MIIRKSPISVLTRSDKPNENWTDEDVFVVDDNSELGKKILSAQPYFEVVLDKQGNLIDITPTDPPAEPPQPPTEVQILQQDVGALLLESAADKAKIADLETLTGALLLEIAALKGGIA